MASRTYRGKVLLFSSILAIAAGTGFCQVTMENAGAGSALFEAGMDIKDLVNGQALEISAPRPASAPAADGTKEILAFEESLQLFSGKYECSKLALDTDGNRQARGGHYLIFDWDRNGALTEKEFCRPSLMNDLRSLDADNSGSLEWAELEKARAYLLREAEFTSSLTELIYFSRGSYLVRGSETYFGDADLGGFSVLSLDIRGLTMTLQERPEREVLLRIKNKLESIGRDMQQDIKDLDQTKKRILRSN